MHELVSKSSAPAMAGALLSEGSSAVRQHTQEHQGNLPGVDDAVAAALRAVGDAAGGKGVFRAVIYAPAAAGEDIHHLAVALVGVQADAAARGQGEMHDPAHGRVLKFADKGLALTALEAGDHGLGQGGKVDPHGAALSSGSP